MRRIKGRHTKPEMLLRSALWASGLRYRLHVRTPAGRPDMVFSKQRIAVFIDGCFWHGCPEHYAFPRTRRDFWSEKLRANVERDQWQTRDLKSQGWAVLRIWEHEVYEELQAVVERVRSSLAGPAWTPRTEWRVMAVEVLDEGRNLERRLLVTVDEPIQTRVEDRRRTTDKSFPPGR